MSQMNWPSASRSKSAPSWVQLRRSRRGGLLMAPGGRDAPDSNATTPPCAYSPARGVEYPSVAGSMDELPAKIAAVTCTSPSVHPGDVRHCAGQRLVTRNIEHGDRQQEL